jgi:26S proteasome regulatory subunit N7
MSDDTPLPIPDISVQQHLFTLLSPRATSAQQSTSRDAILAAVRKDKMTPYYSSLFTIPQVIESGLLKKDTALLKELQEANDADLKAFDEEEKKNQEEEGELEVTAVKRKRAVYYAQIGDKERAMEALKALSSSPSVPVGSRIDMAMTQIRVGLFFGDAHATSQSIEQARM